MASTMAKKKKSLTEAEYSKVCEFINGYRGLSIDCEIEMVNNVFPDIEKTTLSSILHNELCNLTKINHWRLEKKAPEHLHVYEMEAATSNRSSILRDLAIAERMSPVMLCRSILQLKYDLKPKAVTKFLISPNLIKDKKLSANVIQCLSSDNQDGPLQDMRRRVLGEEYETKLKEMTKNANISYYDENDLRRMGYDKTPDLKIILPFMFQGSVINWIESKAMFGDVRTHKKYLHMQLNSYCNRFGPGIIIYWFGYHEDTPRLKDNSIGVIVLDDFPERESMELLNIEYDLDKKTNVESSMAFEEDLLLTTISKSETTTKVHCESLAEVTTDSLQSYTADISVDAVEL